MIKYSSIKTPSVSKLWALNTITNNMGKVLETEDRIYCFVNNSISELSDINCEGYNDRNKDLRDKYNINKPIYYVFKDIRFNKKVNIYGYDSVNIFIDNCTFKRDTYISTKGDFNMVKSNMDPMSMNSILSNNLVINNSKISFLNKLLLISVNSLEINNSDLKGYDMLTFNPYMCINSCMNNVIINNSNLKADDINISAPNVLFNENSFLEGKDRINITSENINRVIGNTKLFSLNNEVIGNGEINLVRDSSKRIRTIN